MGIKRSENNQCQMNGAGHDYHFDCQSEIIANFLPVVSQLSPFEILFDPSKIFRAASQKSDAVQLETLVKHFSRRADEQTQTAWELLQADLADAVQAQDEAALQQSAKQLINTGVSVFGIPQLDEQLKDARADEAFWHEQSRKLSYEQPANCSGEFSADPTKLLPHEEQELLAQQKRMKLEQERFDALQAYSSAVEFAVNKQLTAVPDVVFAMLAAQFEVLGEPSFAREAYAKAVASADTVAAKQLFRLQSLRTLPPKELAQHQAEIEEIFVALEQVKPLAKEWSELESKGSRASDIFVAYQLAMQSAADEEEMRQISKAFSDQYGEEFDAFFLDPRVKSETELVEQQKKEAAAIPSAWQPVIDAFDPPQRVAKELQNDLPPGTPDQVAFTQTLAWNLRIQAELASRKPRLPRLDSLKENFAKHLAERNQLPQVLIPEAYLLTHSALLFTQAATAHLEGVVEASYLKDEGDTYVASGKLAGYRQLVQDTEKLLDKVPEEARGGLREKLARLNWQVEVDGRNSLHQYTAAFEDGIRQLEQSYGDTQVFRAQRDAYAKLYPEHFDAQTKQVLSRVDLTETDKSKAAVLREASLAALHGDGVDRFLLTAGYAVVGGGMGCAIGGTIGGGGGFLTPVPGGTVAGGEFGCAVGTFIGGFIGGATGEALHQQETVRRYGPAIREAAEAGVTVVSAAEYSFNQSAAINNIYMSGLTGAVLYGNLARPIGNLLYAGESWAAKALGRLGRGAEAWAGRAAEVLMQEQLAGATGYGSLNLMSQAVGGTGSSGLTKAAVERAATLVPQGPWKERVVTWLKEWGKDLGRNTYDAIINGQLNPTELARIAALRESGVVGRVAAKVYESYIKWSSPIYFFGGLAAAGYDASDGELSAAGGITAALGPMPAIQKIAFGIRRSGTRVAVGFTLGMEWMNQWQQGIDLTEPDGWRLLTEAFWAGPLRAYMNVVVQGGSRINGTLITPFVAGGQQMVGAVPGVGPWLNSNLFVSLEHASRGPGALVPLWRPDASGRAVHTFAGRSAALAYLTPAIAIVSYRLAQDQNGDFANTFKGRFFDYAVASYLFFPIKARLGMDTGRAEFFTRTLGIAQRWPTNELYKKYTADLPGYRLALGETLEGRQEDALARAFKAMTEWTPAAGLIEPEGDGRWYDISARASGTYRRINLEALEGVDGVSDHDYGQLLTYHIRDRELNLEQAAEAYLDFVTWKLNKWGKETDHPAFLEELLLIDQDILESFITRTKNATSAIKAEWSDKYAEIRSRLTRKAQAILDSNKAIFDLIETHYYRTPEGVLKRIEGPEKL